VNYTEPQEPQPEHDAESGTPASSKGERPMPTGPRRVDDVLKFDTSEPVLHERPRGRITIPTVFAARDGVGQVVVWRSAGPDPEPLAVIGDPGQPSAEVARWVRHLALGIELLDMAADDPPQESP
jgi:hypothetical protein